MSRNIGNYDDDGVFEIGDIVSFDHEEERLTGRVVRVYNSRLHYHVLVDDNRYLVSLRDDNPRKES